MEVLRGEGGDGGIDVVVRDEADDPDIIFQLKFFPGGFTGGHRDTRQRQIKKSFNMAWDKHKPRTWILIMPSNPHKNELAWVRKLGDGKQVKIHMWGQAHLDRGLAAHPEIEKAALHDGVVAVLSQFGQQRAALASSGDAQTLFKGMVEELQTRSQYWATEVSVQDGELTESYRPKRHDAIEREPIRETITISLGPEDQHIHEQIAHSINYGAFAPIRLPGSAAAFKRTGPAWIQPFPKLEHLFLEIQPVNTILEKEEPITINVLDEHGCAVGRFPGKILERAQGRMGHSAKARFANIATAIISTPTTSDLSDPGSIVLNFTLDEPNVTDAEQAIKLLDSMQPGATLEFYWNGKKKGRVKLGSELKASSEVDIYTRELLSDLLFLQGKLTDTSFSLPTEVTAKNRAYIRIARLLLQGKRTVMPPGTSLTAVLSGLKGGGLERLLHQGGPYTSNFIRLKVNILGSSYNLGAATMFHPNVVIANADKVDQKFNEDNAQGYEIRLQPQDDQLIQVWLGDWNSGAGEIPVSEPWGLSNFYSPETKAPQE
ncbi:hypothetical protein [Arthrobacter sp. ZBG10]|uniref:hypothetical protein n=1 Tax=Arthrobacter sp. ZBG10 TaxID=1676590 RepID=UPI0012FB3ED2|nr:hypothetical protein [Arthrobacter sp. ZBG10]